MKLHLNAGAEASQAPSLLSMLGRILGKTQAKASLKEMNLSLTITFGEQEIEPSGLKRLGGQVAFGVRKGQLRLILNNCKLPIEKTPSQNPLPESIDVERQKTKGNEIQAEAGLDSRKIGAKASEGLSEKTTTRVFQIKKKGDDGTPAWVFETYSDNILEGTLQERLLGVLHIAEHPCEMTATFTVRGEDIRITWGKLGLVNDIHRNKLAVIERAIALRCIKSMVESTPICQGRWRHG
ncbi:hypothetical protein NDI45_12875 [Leptolyngbya sp. GB1-A1]|uniref:hypothetical protein n=1 Tax=Leptolyngbya sp. GB1-A1 TaxID=2933908 RepID=UPI003296AAA8